MMIPVRMYRLCHSPDRSRPRLGREKALPVKSPLMRDRPHG